MAIKEIPERSATPGTVDTFEMSPAAFVDADGLETMDVVAAPARPLSVAGQDPSRSECSGTSEPVLKEATPLQAEEAARARVWGAVVALLSSTALVFSLFMPGTALLMSVFRGSLAALCLGALWFCRRASRPAEYSANVFRVFGTVAATSQLGLIYYLGPMSPTPVAVMLGIGFFGIGLDRVFAVVLPVYAMAGYMFFCVGTMSGLLPDVGLVRTGDVSHVGQLFFTCLVPMVYLVGLWSARVSRHTMENAIATSNRAVRISRFWRVQAAEHFE